MRGLSFPEQGRENSSQEGSDGRGPSSNSVLTQSIAQGQGRALRCVTWSKGQWPELALVFRTWGRMEEQGIVVKNPEVS